MEWHSHISSLFTEMKNNTNIQLLNSRTLYFSNSPVKTDVKKVKQELVGLGKTKKLSKIYLQKMQEFIFEKSLADSRRGWVRMPVLQAPAQARAW